MGVLKKLRTYRAVSTPLYGYKTQAVSGVLGKISTSVLQIYTKHTNVHCGWNVKF